MPEKKLLKLYKSTNPNKKFDIYVYNKKTGRVKKISFGARGMSDYTIHKDKDRRERYRNRHRSDRINDPFSPGFWSWHVLWGTSTDKQKCLEGVIRKYKLVKRIPKSN